jgi:hypothetical protein
MFRNITSSLLLCCATILFILTQAERVATCIGPIRVLRLTLMLEIGPRDRPEQHLYRFQRAPSIEGPPASNGARKA